MTMRVQIVSTLARKVSKNNLGPIICGVKFRRVFVVIEMRRVVFMDGIQMICKNKVDVKSGVLHLLVFTVGI